MLRFSIHPLFPNASTKTCQRGAIIGSEGGGTPSKPMRRFPSCATAASGHTAVVKTSVARRSRLPRLPCGIAIIKHGRSARARQKFQTENRPEAIGFDLNVVAGNPEKNHRRRIKCCHYREQAERAARLARGVTRSDVAEQLQRIARDYADLAEDLEIGADEIRHPELMPQRRL